MRRDYWHYEWCPACGMEGIQMRYNPETMTTEEEPCQPCGGTGRMPVPNGYQLKPTSVPFIFGGGSSSTKALIREQGE